ncbi:MAG: type II toxin-antitoxin system VapC family toxin [Pseudonocardiaceae bacterium]
MLLDTHVLLWWHAGGELLSARAAREIARAEKVLVSPISCWEDATLVRKRRVRLDRPVADWCAQLFREDRVARADLDPAAATWAGSLDETFPGDPADRLIFATAFHSAAPLISRDEKLRNYAKQSPGVRVIW